ncbi:zinc finger protein GLIS2-like, partial [Oxyura jamaicensis]|uniref:zinc finger protein GLIS2-like n=1 Tax=Oxyura jamaicensis TaxID=8884 RepID=UPI0015A6AF4C
CPPVAPALRPALCPPPPTISSPCATSTASPAPSSSSCRSAPGGPCTCPPPPSCPPPKDKRLSPELPLPKQLVCRWSKCNQFFDLLQDLVDHVNDFHVKPEKDAGYCCHWEGCARHGRGFNA